MLGFNQFKYDESDERFGFVCVFCVCFVGASWVLCGCFVGVVL